MIKKFKIKVNKKEYLVEVEEVDEGGVEGDSLKRRDVEEEKPQEEKKIIKKGEKIIYAPMPAKVIKVACKVGERVKKGDILIVLEAMKMENEIISPTDGVVKEIRVTEGINISHNEVMLVFE